MRRRAMIWVVVVAMMMAGTRAQADGGWVLPEVRSHLLAERTYEAQAQVRAFSGGELMTGAAWATGVGKWELALSAVRFEGGERGDDCGEHPAEPDEFHCSRDSGASRKAVREYAVVGGAGSRVQFVAGAGEGVRGGDAR